MQPVDESMRLDESVGITRMTAMRIWIFVSVLTVIVATPLLAQVPNADLAQVREKMKAGYGANVTLNQTGRNLQIRLDHPKISSNAYTGALRILCVHLGANAKRLDSIAILNKHGAQGYVYETPGQCAAVAAGKVQDVSILGSTHSF